MVLEYPEPRHHLFWTFQLTPKEQSIDRTALRLWMIAIAMQQPACPCTMVRYPGTEAAAMGKTRRTPRKRQQTQKFGSSSSLLERGGVDERNKSKANTILEDAPGPPTRLRVLHACNTRSPACRACVRVWASLTTGEESLQECAQACACVLVCASV